MKKALRILLYLSILILTNALTAKLAVQKHQEEISTSLSNCFLMFDKEDDVKIDLNSNNRGSNLSILNNSNCLTIKEIEVDLIYRYNKNIDTIGININEPIKPNIEASMQLKNVIKDSLLSINFEIKKIDLF